MDCRRRSSSAATDALCRYFIGQSVTETYCFLQDQFIFIQKLIKVLFGFRNLRLDNRLLHLIYLNLCDIKIKSIYFEIYSGPRVAILGFFAASVNGGNVYIWFILLIHCLLMAIFFRPQNDLNDSDSSTTIITKWVRKTGLVVCLVFTQLFTFIPFNKRKQKNKQDTHVETDGKTSNKYEDAYIQFFYLVNKC